MAHDAGHLHPSKQVRHRGTGRRAYESALWPGDTGRDLLLDAAGDGMVTLEV